MWVIYKKEISAFFRSFIAYVVMAVFLTLLGLLMWVFPDTSLLYYPYATLDQLFAIAPFVFLLLIPAITMRSFAEENQNGTLEWLTSKPLRDIDIVGGKFLASWTLVLFALLPTLLYYYTIYDLGSPRGNLDSGAIAGSYLGLVLLAGVFTAIGMMASAMSNNQIVAFIASAFLCFVFYSFFDFFSKLPIFVGVWDDFVQKLGIAYHYNSVSRGLVDSRDIVYFLTLIAGFIYITWMAVHTKKW
jgi:ABC-2 type transport system permease protein